MAQLNFNGAGQEAMDDFSVVPADVYNVQVVKSEVVDTKARAEGKKQNPPVNILGSLLKLQFKIIDGKFKGRIIFGQYNLENPNAQAIEISRKQMKTLCDAIGKPDGVGDSNEMHNIPLSVKVGVKPAQGVYAEQNEIKFYSKYSGPSVEGNTASGSGPGNPASGAKATEEVAEASKQGEAAGDEKSSGGAPWNKG